MRIIIDPAKGGSELGCKVGDLHEKDYTLCFSRHLARKLSRANHIVCLTRARDCFLSYAERAKKTKDFDAELALVVSLNSNDAAMASGMQLYSYEVGGRLAGLLAAYSPNIAGAQAFRIDRMEETWVRPVANQLKRYEAPAVLVKLGYASNLADLERLKNPIYQFLLGACITAAVCRYSEILTQAQLGADCRDN